MAKKRWTISEQRCLAKKLHPSSKAFKACARKEALISKQRNRGDAIEQRRDEAICAEQGYSKSTNRDAWYACIDGEIEARERRTTGTRRARRRQGLRGKLGSSKLTDKQWWDGVLAKKRK